LDDAEDLDEQSLDRLNRIYLVNNPTITQFADLLRGADPYPKRVMHVDLDYIYDPDPEQQEKNLGLLLERIKSSGVNAVYLQAFGDEAGTGVANSLYFNNRHLPVKADLFGRASWQIRTRLRVNVYAWMPLLAFNPSPEKSKALDWVESVDGSSGIGYRRLSPFSERSRQFIRDIYEDLARYTYFYGIVIHDDATLSDKEDASQVALAYYQKNWGLPPSVQDIAASAGLREKWMTHKTEALTNFALELKQVAEEYKKPLRMSRNYYAEVALNPRAQEWFAQSISNGLSNFDTVALMAMPYMEKAANPKQWLKDLVDHTKDYPGARQKIIYELQAKNWDTKKAIPSEELRDWMRMLRIQGALNFGYYPDDPFTNHPNMSVIRRELSTESQVFE
jgi:biofilm PGA synthesis lipoprotein PgaB